MLTACELKQGKNLTKGRILKDVCVSSDYPRFLSQRKSNGETYDTASTNVRDTPAFVRHGSRWCGDRFSSCVSSPRGGPGPNPDAPGQIQKANGPTVSTSDGPVRGFVQNGVNEFLGIPYAAPPVGDLRWKPPAPPASHALLDATQFANTCPQVTTLGPFAGPTSTTEDCLYLNVFTTGTSPKKPVLVWIHGGANLDGESNDYDGSKLATGGPLGTPTVVVTINYRLGLFGILSESHLNAEGHSWGNYGILDQQAVLRWVQANISAFGGDPQNVTVGGQSAGAYDTSANLISPASAGLFQRAIIQSFPPSTWTTAAVALQHGNAFAAATGCSDAACLRRLTAERILQLQGTPNASNSSFLNNIFVDGTIIPQQPDVAWGSGAYNKMPILGGSVKDESNFNLAITEYFSGPPQVALTATQYTNNNPANVVAEYPLSSYGNDPQLAQDRVSTDRTKCQYLHSFKLMASTNSYGLYTYDFTYQNAPYYFPYMPNVSSPDWTLPAARSTHHRHPIFISGLSWRTVGSKPGSIQRSASGAAGRRDWPF